MGDLVSDILTVLRGNSMLSIGLWIFFAWSLWKFIWAFKARLKVRMEDERAQYTSAHTAPDVSPEDREILDMLARTLAGEPNPETRILTRGSDGVIRAPWLPPSETPDRGSAGTQGRGQYPMRPKPPRGIQEETDEQGKPCILEKRKRLIDLD